MKKLTILAGAAALVAGSAASAQVVQLDTPTNPVGNSYTYTTGSGNITATGFSAPDTEVGLYSKNFGGDENGIGLVNDPSGQHEISDAIGNFIQLDLTALNAGTMVSFSMGSTTDGEGWAVFGTNDWGCAVSGLFQCGTEVAAATDDEGAYHALTGGFSYYDFYATGTSNNAPSNVLLSSLLLAPVPEPATWAMMLIGFGAIGFAARRNRRKIRLAQLA